MGKTGIITIVNGNNYGNVLQNYALQKALKKLGYDSETIDRVSSNSGSSFFYNFRIFLSTVFRKLTRKPLYSVNRIVNFRRFRKKYIKYSKFRAGKCFPKTKEKEYDTFIFGSDQIWNLRFEFVCKERDIFFGKFTSKDKKISYASSFGTSFVPDEYSKYVQNCLKDFRSISVREYAGKDICSKFGIKSETVPDPTLLLSAEQWRKIEKCPQNCKGKKYLLTYFLGEVSDGIKQEISQYAQNNGLEIVNINNSFKYCTTRQDMEHFSDAPDEFLWLIDHCTSFVTDSFHGTVFSLIFRKPFQVIERVANEENNNMNSRLTTLLGIFNESKRLDSERIIADFLQNPPDREATAIQGRLRKQGFQYLKAQLPKGVS